MSDFTVVKLLDRLNPTIITGGFVPRGAYDNATDYAVGDSVDYNGSSYVMYADAVAGTLPTDTNYWQVVANGGVSSVNTKSGIVVIDPDDLDDTATTNKFTTAGEITKLSGIETGADVTDTANVTSAGALMDFEVTSLSGVKSLTVPDSTTISAFGATLTDDSDAATARTTLGVDAAGTDNSTDVTLGTNTATALSLSGQELSLADVFVQLAGDTMTGDLIFSGAQKIIGGTGTTSDLTLQTTSGVGATGADMHFLVGNNGDTEAMTILNSGNVGIGTASPGFLLHVQKTAAAGVAEDLARFTVSDDSTSYFAIRNSTTADGVFAPTFRGNSSGTNAAVIFQGSITTDSGSNPVLIFQAGASTVSTRPLFDFRNAASSQLLIAASGNVGIGTTAPQATLDIVHTNNAAGGIRLQDNLTNATTKVGRIKIGHYTNAEEPVTAMLIFSTSVSNEINYGGGSGTENAATALNFYTGATTTTTTGAIRMMVNSAGNVGIGTTVPTNLLSLGGNSARTFWMERHTTANTAGNTLTITAGGATSGATDKAGGNLILQGGLSTGNAESGVIIQGDAAGASGTSDGTQATMIQVLGNKIGLFGVTPVVRPAAANQAALTNSTGGTYDGTLVDVGVIFNQANINNNFTDIHTLLTEIRTALVNIGAIKGSA